jgi:hypothetical protein
MQHLAVVPNEVIGWCWLTASGSRVPGARFIKFGHLVHLPFCPCCCPATSSCNPGQADRFLPLYYRRHDEEIHGGWLAPTRNKPGNTMICSLSTSDDGADRPLVREPHDFSRTMRHHKG